jgi:capsular exopolysaccharide synthesis family protein
VEKQTLRNVELYKNGPVEMQLAGDNPRSGFSFEVSKTKDSQVALTKFQIKDEKIKDIIIGNFGDTLQTPVGKVVIYPVESENEFKCPIRISWSNSMASAKAYANRLNLSLSGKESSVIVISMNDTYPSRAASVISTLIDVYNEVWINNKNRAAINTTEFINERLVIIERDLATVEDALKKYKSSNNLTDIKTAAKTYIDESSLYATKSFEVSNQLSIAEFIKSYLNDPVNSMSLIPSNLGLTSASVESQIAEYNKIVLQRDRLVAGSGDRNPLIADMNASLVSIRSAILRSVENLISTLKLQLSKIDSQEKQILSRMSSSSGQELQLLSIERQQQITQNLYIFLLEKREENELASLINVGNTRVIMNPNGPSSPVSPNRMMVIFAMFVLGFGCPFAFFFLVKMLDKSIKNRADLGNLSVPFLAEIPRYIKEEDRYKKFRKRNDNDRSVCGIMVEQGNRDMMNEAFRVLRTNIDLMLGKKPGAKVIMLTSFNPNAGKTFTVMNLAASMALKNAKVMLVDLDLRKASLSKALDLVHTGVAGYLNGKVDDYHKYTDAVAPNLHVMPLGTLPPNPTELLLSERFGQMISSMRGEYDYIFLDCPPIDIVADASIITEVADMSIFVMRANQMTKDILPQIQTLYSENKYNHMAMILNSVDIQYKKYGYGKSSYGYGYGYTGTTEIE